MSLHSRPKLAETEPAPGVFFAAKKQHLDALVLSEEPAYKVFVGHAGWGAGQLESELQQGAWRTVARHRRMGVLDRRSALGDGVPPTRPVAAEIDAAHEGIAAGSDGKLGACRVRPDAPSFDRAGASTTHPS